MTHVILTVSQAYKQRPRKVRHYLQALQAAGASVTVMAPDEFRPDHPALARMRGLVLGGGGDVHPRRYNQPANGTEMHSVDEARDAMEWALLEMACQRDLPVLAICRGFQVLNVFLGGTLTQHVPGHRPPSEEDDPVYHQVRLVPGTRLWEALGRVDVLLVNSYHHQAVRTADLSPHLRASAWATHDPSLLEGIESVDHRWVVGVQWHPERLHEFPDPVRERHAGLFHHFVRAAAARVVAVGSP